MPQRLRRLATIKAKYSGILETIIRQNNRPTVQMSVQEETAGAFDE
jgi:hypothetical protein